MEKGRKGKEEEQDNITDNTYRTLYTSTFPIPTHTAKQIPPTGLRGGRESNIVTLHNTRGKLLKDQSKRYIVSNQQNSIHTTPSLFINHNCNNIKEGEIKNPIRVA